MMPREPFPFKGDTHLFYRRIEPEHFSFNGVLYELRTQPERRRELLDDPDGFAAARGLDPRAVRALYDNDIARVVECGGHPILGWTVILLLRFDRGDTSRPGHDHESPSNAP